MTKEKATKYLINTGWNYDGANAIVSTLEDDGILQEITVRELEMISEDYKDR